MAQNIIQFIKSNIVPLTIVSVVYLIVITLLLVAIFVVCIINFNRYKKIREGTIPIFQGGEHKLLKKIKDLENSVDILQKKNEALATENKKQEELITNVGKGLKETNEAINSTKDYIQNNHAELTDVIAKINYIESTLLDSIPEFSPCENDEFDDISMLTDDSDYGQYVEQTVGPGKKLGKCIIKRAVVKRKEKKETKDE